PPRTHADDSTDRTGKYGRTPPSNHRGVTTTEQRQARERSAGLTAGFTATRCRSTVFACRSDDQDVFVSYARLGLALPVTLRNQIFARSAVISTAVAAGMLWLNIVSSWRLDWVGVAVLVAAAIGAVFYALSFARATLRVDPAGVVVGGS